MVTSACFIGCDGRRRSVARGSARIIRRSSSPSPAVTSASRASPCTARFGRLDDRHCLGRPRPWGSDPPSAPDTPTWVNTLPYLVVGWAAVAVMPQIYRGGGPLRFSWWSPGGLAYSVGAVFYGPNARLSPRSLATTSSSTPSRFWARDCTSPRSTWLSLGVQRRHHVEVAPVTAPASRRDGGDRSVVVIVCATPLRRARPSAHAVADLMGDTWLTIAKCS